MDRLVLPPVTLLRNARRAVSAFWWTNIALQGANGRATVQATEERETAAGMLRCADGDQETVKTYVRAEWMEQLATAIQQPSSLHGDIGLSAMLDRARLLIALISTSVLPRSPPLTLSQFP